MLINNISLHWFIRHFEFPVEFRYFESLVCVFLMFIFGELSFQCLSLKSCKGRISNLFSTFKLLFKLS